MEKILIKSSMTQAKRLKCSFKSAAANSSKYEPEVEIIWNQI